MYQRIKKGCPVLGIVYVVDGGAGLRILRTRHYS
jgi:hypothetical protein